MGTVLVVEDDESIRNSLDILLSREGHKVIVWPCSTGVEKLIQQIHPDFVLTDHNLGEGEEAGFSLAIRLKDKGFKVMLMSADPFIGEAAAANDLSFIQKPFDIKPLISKIAGAAHA